MWTDLVEATNNLYPRARAPAHEIFVAEASTEETDFARNQALGGGNHLIQRKTLKSPNGDCLANRALSSGCPVSSFT